MNKGTVVEDGQEEDDEEHVSTWFDRHQLSDSRLLLQLGLVIFLLAVAYVSYRVARAFVRFERDRYTADSDLSAANMQTELNIDSLPAVKIDYGKWRPNTDSGDQQDDDDDVAARRVRCLQRGVYLGPENEYRDCADYCRVSSESEVSYAFVADPSRMISGRSATRPGAWCLPQSAANCNTSTSTLVYSLNGWLCIPRSDAFAGDGGNRITVCDGSIRDNAMNSQYDEYVPANLMFQDFYEDRLADGRYRFECVPGKRDDLGNEYLLAPFNRFHLLHNYCVSGIPFALTSARPDFANGTCNCPDPYSVSQAGDCSACRVGFDRRTFTFNLRVQPCFSVRDNISFVLDLQRRTAVSGELVRPCGLDAEGKGVAELTRPRCVIAQLPIYKHYLPSPSTMNYIRESMATDGLPAD